RQRSAGARYRYRQLRRAADLRRSHRSAVLMRSLISVACLAGLAACAALADAEPAVLDASSCTALAKLGVPAAKIGLPTRGAELASTTLVTADERTPAHCLVTGRILPADKSAPNIEFKVALPTQ